MQPQMRFVYGALSTSTSVEFASVRSECFGRTMASISTSISSLTIERIHVKGAAFDARRCEEFLRARTPFERRVIVRTQRDMKRHWLRHAVDRYVT
jgi:hypothetical protein